MKKLDAEIDEKPELCSQMIANEVSNHLAFCELTEYETHGRFLYQHPILFSEKLTDDLDELRRASPQRFMQELVNADNSITRYESLIRNNKHKDNEELTRWQALINEYKHKLGIMQHLIKK